MYFGKKIFGILIFILIASSGVAQNHRQFSNWICGDFSITKKDNAVIGQSHIVNLSNIDSNNYWLVEDISLNKLTRQRLLHIVLLDSGYVGVDIYNLKREKLIQAITSFKQIKFANYQKANLSKLIFYYNRPARGFEIYNNLNRVFYLDKYSLIVKCCGDFSDFYFDTLKNEKELTLLKKSD
jgi:hypothetical protein